MAADSLVWAIKNGDKAACEQAAKAPNFDVNAELLNGRNALHYAADYGQADIVKYLCSLKANVNLPDKHGITPLLAAVYENHVECARVLISSGAKTTGKAPSGESYLEVAESDDMKDLLK